MKNFAIIGVAGYVAERHVKAIKETNNNLVACLDKFDSVGFLDSFFPETAFFTEFERFDRHIDRISNTDKKVDFVSICTPNYLHDAHIRFALRNDADAICEKPIVLNPNNVDALVEFEQKKEKNIFTILQLRLHPEVIKLKQKIDLSPKKEKYNINLTYITSRGSWYDYSWKGNPEKSGGIATNIGIHFFDMLIWIFGDVISSKLYISEKHTVAGFLELETANVNWFLSIDEKTLPKKIREAGQRTYRSLTIENEEFNFSNGFTNLHTESYRQILNGNGFRIIEAKKAVATTAEIRNLQISNISKDFFVFLKTIE